MTEWLVTGDDVEHLRVLLLSKRASHECEFATYVLENINYRIQQGSVMKQLLQTLAQIRSIHLKDFMNSVFGFTATYSGYDSAWWLKIALLPPTRDEYLNPLFQSRIFTDQCSFSNFGEIFRKTFR